MKNSRTWLNHKVAEALRLAFRGESKEIYTSKMAVTEEGTGQYVIARKDGAVSAPTIVFADKKFLLPICVLFSRSYSHQLQNREILEQDYERFIGGRFAFQKHKQRMKGLFTHTAKLVPYGLPLPLDFPEPSMVVVLTNFALPANDEQHWLEKGIHIIPLSRLEELAFIIPKSAGISRERLAKSLIAEKRYFQDQMIK